jgi:hypothetical protein
MYERSYGYKYEEGGKLDTAAIAKLIRRDIKTAIREGMLPDRWKYSVTIDRFAGGSSIDVRVKDCADAWMACPGYRIGTRHDLPSGGYTATACGRPDCTGEHMVLTQEAEVAKMTLQRIHFAYNHDGSDSMIDYFDVNYYGHVDFQSRESARWEAEHRAEKAAAKAAREAAPDAGFRIKNYNRRTGHGTVHAAVNVDGKTKLACGARLMRGGFYSKTDEAVTCSRCAKHEASSA